MYIVVNAKKERNNHNYAFLLPYRLCYLIETNGMCFYCLITTNNFVIVDKILAWKEKIGEKCCRQQKKLRRLVKAAKENGTKKRNTKEIRARLYCHIFRQYFFRVFFFFKFKITKVMHRLIHKLSFLLACFHSLNFRIIYYVSVAFFITCAFLIKWYFICKSFSLLDTDSPHRNSNCSLLKMRHHEKLLYPSEKAFSQCHLFIFALNSQSTPQYWRHFQEYPHLMAPKLLNGFWNYLFQPMTMWKRDIFWEKKETKQITQMKEK